MKQNNNTPTEKRKKALPKKVWLHYLLVYLVCLLAACVVWLLVRYTMRTDKTEKSGLLRDAAGAAVIEAEPAETDAFYG